ncbi:MAG: response regulator [Caldilineaceae bacterium]|nr:response regulator [Caldilineaceae bacterium]
MHKKTIEQTREQRQRETTRQINAALADLVDVARHNVVRQQLLTLIAQAAGYSYALQSEMELDGHHMRVTALACPLMLKQMVEKVLGFQLIGYRFVNEPAIALQTPPIEQFTHLQHWRAEIALPVAATIELVTGLRQIVSIRLHTGEHYLGAATFFATQPNTDLPLLEYLCNNHLVYAVRLMHEQSERARLQALRTEELERQIQERKQAEEARRESEDAIRGLYTITANRQMSFTEKVQALLKMGCERFGMQQGILAQIVEMEYLVVEGYAPMRQLHPGDTWPLSLTYCCETLHAPGPMSFEHAAASAWAAHPGYLATGLEAYLGTAVQVPIGEVAQCYGTLSFASVIPRPTPFQTADHEFLSLMAQWIGGEIERQQKAAQLQAYAQKIEQANQALAIARDQALEASRLKSEFLATMSHEIRTPMNGIIGMTELIMSTELTARQREYGHIVLKEADHLLTVINDILDFSKMEAGRLTLEDENFTPTIVVEGVAELLAPQAAAKSIALMTFISPQVPTILRGDAGRFRQVLLNLVGNAIKFTEQGEVVVRLELISQQSQQVELACYIEDSGIGIDSSELHRLFQPFSQVDGSVSRRHGGTGLGLAIASRLVKFMGGEIGVESSPGKGSTFWFTIIFKAPRVRLHPPSNTHPRFVQVHLLLVASHPTLCTLLQSYLQAWGIHVDAVPSVNEALLQLAQAYALEQPYQLALVDLELPDQQGFLFGQAVVTEPTFAKTRLVGLTAFIDKEQEQAAIAAGYTTCLSKPVRQERLQTSLMRALSHVATKPRLPTSFA